jgi:hypothetical protein
LNPAAISILRTQGYEKVRVRSPLHCELKRGICEACYGWEPSKRDWPRDGFPIGVLAAQSVGERMSQEVLKILHRPPELGSSPLLHEEFDDCMRLQFKEEAVLQLLDKFNGKGLAVDPRHFEVLLRVARRVGRKLNFEDPAKDLSRGWLSVVPVHSSRNSVVTALREATIGRMIDELKGSKSRILLGLDGRPHLKDETPSESPVLGIIRWQNRFKVVLLRPPRPKGKRERRILYKRLFELAKLLEGHYASGNFDAARIPKAALRRIRLDQDRILTWRILLPDRRGKALGQFVRAEDETVEDRNRNLMRELERRVDWRRGQVYATMLKEYPVVFGRPLARKDLERIHQRLKYWHKERLAGRER